MKTAKQWNEEYSRICFNDPAVHGQLLPNPQNIAFIEQVLLDAYKAGLTKAAEIARSMQESEFTIGGFAARRIESFRDSLTTIPKE